MSWIEVEVAGRSHRVAAARGTEGLWISIAGRSSFHPDPKRHAKGAGQGIEQDEVRAPMTGKVVAVEVAAGDSVAEGALIAILEAMKMEYRLTAPRAGKVAGVHCMAGELVDLGKPIVTLLALPPAG